MQQWSHSCNHVTQIKGKIVKILIFTCFLKVIRDILNSLKRKVVVFFINEVLMPLPAVFALITSLQESFFVCLCEIHFRHLV